MASLPASTQARRSARLLEKSHEKKEKRPLGTSSSPPNVKPIKRRRIAPNAFAPKKPRLPRAARNDQGLPSLPPELIDEIMSYIPVLNLPTYNLMIPLQAKETMDRRLCVLRALSQTCKALRRLTIGSAWERIEIVSSKYDSARRWEKELVHRLLQHLECAAKNAVLGEQVKTVVFLWTGLSSKSITPKVAKYLSQLPNLKTLRILGSGGDYQHFESAFDQYTLPNVWHLSIPISVRPVLRSCPRLQSLEVIWPPGCNRCNNCHASRDEIQDELRRDIVQYCDCLKEVEGCGCVFMALVEISRLQQVLKACIVC